MLTHNQIFTVYKCELNLRTGSPLRKSHISQPSGFFNCNVQCRDGPTGCWVRQHFERESNSGLPASQQSQLQLGHGTLPQRTGETAILDPFLPSLSLLAFFALLPPHWAYHSWTQAIQCLRRQWSIDIKMRFLICHDH